MKFINDFYKAFSRDAIEVSHFPVVGGAHSNWAVLWLVWAIVLSC